MTLTGNSINQNKAAIFDWLVFSLSVLLSLCFPELKDIIVSGLFSGWMLACLLLYVAGIWLKRKAVFYRAAHGSRPLESISFRLFLIIGHWLIMLAVVIVAERAFRSIAGLPEILGSANISGLRVCSAIAVAGLLTWFVFRRSKGGKKQLSKNHLFWRETVADILLITAVSVLSFVFWEKSILAAVGLLSMNSFSDISFLFFFLSFAYMLFYLPLRYLYLLEDFNGGAWRRLFLIFILILVRGLFEAWRI